MPPHRAQLLVCHEKIAGPMENDRRRGHEQWCNLSAYAWCFDCEHYTCDIHLNSMHELHNAVIEYPKQTFVPGDHLRSQGPREPLG